VSNVLAKLGVRNRAEAVAHTAGSPGPTTADDVGDAGGASVTAIRGPR
jgi:hypothetical protein